MPVHQSSFPSTSGQTLTVPSSFRGGELPRRLPAPFARNVIPGAHAADWARSRACLLLAPPGIDAQPTGKVYRIGYLAIGKPDDERPFVDAFRQGLREFGWVEGQNVSIEYRFADGETARLPGLAAELVRLNVDLLFALASPPAKAAQQATDSVPIVFSGVADPIGVGLVPRLARPGGNVTGFTTSNVELELLKGAVPNLTHVAVFVNRANPQPRRAGSTRDTLPPSIR